MESPRVIKMFQIYGRGDEYPDRFHIVGSNDRVTWTSLYYTYNGRSEQEGQIPHGSSVSAFSFQIEVPNEIPYRYCGIAPLSSGTYLRSLIQEVLLWGTHF